ncbi:MAG TPA: hypothetical protein VFI47_16875 [Acidimicrobiales bacterium]|nr:hypothetical protein [Acidimicrobiales bacterium]
MAEPLSDHLDDTALHLLRHACPVTVGRSPEDVATADGVLDLLRHACPVTVGRSPEDVATADGVLDESVGEHDTGAP